MSNSVKLRGLLVVGCLILAMLALGPTLMGKKTPEWWAKSFDPISLGLDLQGGMYLVLGVDVDEAVKARVDSMTEQIETVLREKDVVFKRIERRDFDQMVIIAYDPETAAEIETTVKENYPRTEVETLPADGGYVEKHFRLDEQTVSQTQEYAIKQALETLRNRVDEFGVSEPTLQRQSGNRILIQLPGIKDPQRAIDLIGKTALLEFKMVAEDVDLAEAQKGNLPPGTELLYLRNVNPQTQQVTETPIVVYTKTSLTGDMLADARTAIDTRYNDPYVALEFNSQGAKRFEQITAANTGKRMAIVLDDTVFSAPVIRDRIAGGRAQISGGFTPKEATDLAIVLRAGSLPAPVKILENRTVGASLGADSIQKGIMSIVIGGLLVIVAIAVYYQLAGLIAVTALALNIVFISAMLALFGATLTMPGIAGIVLTIGMAVDANVLVFERIREEVRLGVSARKAIDAGFAKALSTILDANVTTLVAALILFQFGTGPVKGFAVTLSIGIIASLFTAVFVSRLVFDSVLERKQVKRLSI